MRNERSKTLAIVPAFNEEERIGQVLRKIGEVDKEIDVVIIDDGSTDGTGLASRMAGAKVIKLSSNMGYGVAIQTGYKYAFAKGYDFVVQLDSDGQHNPAYIPQMLEVAMSGNADLVIGSRFKNQKTPLEPSETGYEVGMARRLGIRLTGVCTSLQ